MHLTRLCWNVICVVQTFKLCNCQWQLLLPNNEGPTPRKGHSLTTWNAGDKLVLFGGRSQSFALCEWPYNWDNETCGDHVFSPLVDTSIVLASQAAPYTNCSNNCSDNGWCHYEEPIDDAYCICYDDYRGHVCQYREIQSMEYDIWLFDIKTLLWTQYELSIIIFYPCANNLMH